jgi:dTDP-4-dehydrorhamnose reductase
MARNRVLVLGATGMLGSMVYRYFQKTHLKTAGTILKGEKKRVAGQSNIIQFDAEASDAVLYRVLKTINPDWIINCIGIIKPYCKDDDPVGIRRAITVNALFPFRLAELAQKNNARVIQIATDCVYSGRQGKYDEAAVHDPLDVYGKTKSLGEARADAMLHVRCSIVGPEPWTNVSLLAWFLSQPENVTLQGYTHHHWNGVTTLQFAQCCEMIMQKGTDYFDSLVKMSPVHHFVPNKTVSKYRLLRIFKQVWKRRVKIVPASTPEAVDRTLDTSYHELVAKPKSRSMLEALQALKDYYES